jgi:hypothetical protein
MVDVRLHKPQLHQPISGQLYLTDYGPGPTCRPCEPSSASATTHAELSIRDYVG